MTSNEQFPNHGQYSDDENNNSDYSDEEEEDDDNEVFAEAAIDKIFSLISTKK